MWGEGLSGLLSRGKRVRFELIHAEMANYLIDMLYRVLEVSRSGYYRWRSAEPSNRTRADEKLKPATAKDHATRWCSSPSISPSTPYVRYGKTGATAW